MKNIIFYLGIGTLFTHELDAMSNHEWRVLPLTNWLPDELGMTVFLSVHIPLCACLVALVASNNDLIRNRTKMGISVFLIVHGLLHAIFMGNASYEFPSVLSNTLIFGGALLGVLYVLSDYIEKHRTST